MHTAVVQRVSGMVAWVVDARDQVAETVALLPVQVGQRVAITEVDPPSGQLVTLGPLGYAEPVYPVDGTAATPSLRTLGTGSQQAAAGDHGHTVDAAAATGSFRTIGAGALQAAAGNHTHTAAPTDGSAATPSLRTLGTGALQAAAGNHTHSNPTVSQLPVSIPRGQVALAETTVDVTGLSEASVATLTFTVDNTRRYEIIGKLLMAANAASNVVAVLRGATGGSVATTDVQFDISRGFVNGDINANSANVAVMFLYSVIPPGRLSAGTWTLGIFGREDGATSTAWVSPASSFSRSTLVVKDIGV